MLQQLENQLKRCLSFLMAFLKIKRAFKEEKAFQGIERDWVQK
jgi:hypothetical protein